MLPLSSRSYAALSKMYFDGNLNSLDLQMDEELPLVENIDEGAVDHGDEQNSQRYDSLNIESIPERQDNFSQRQENETNDTQVSSESDELQEANLDEPNLEDQQLFIYLEGAPDYPVVQRVNENAGEEVGDSTGEEEDHGNNLHIDLRNQYERAERRGIVIEDGNRMEMNNEDNSDENVSDPEDDQDDDSIITVASSSVDGDSQNEDDNQTERETFDTELPGQHQYMGESREIGGRIILEENLYVDIPVISQPGIILMPGQTLPMTFFQPSVISMMKRLVETTKTFGVLHKRYRSSQPGLVEEASVGTTAEIYECREPSASSTDVGYHIKAKGRQRFRLISIRRQADGNRIATVDILREKVLSDPLYETRLISRDRLRPFSPDPVLPNDSLVKPSIYNEECNDTLVSRASNWPDANTPTQEPSASGIKESLSNLLSRLTSSNAEKKLRERENKEEFLPEPLSFKFTKRNNLRTAIYKPPVTPFPNWLYELYDPQCLVERIHEALANFKLFSQTQVAIPKNPQELSYWVATNLPLDDAHRMTLLKLDCTIQRLRCELSLLERSNILCCRNCGETLALQSDIFSMSREGPQGSYVNPGGYVHETLTLYKVKNVLYTGQPSTEYSWFPGYAWQICQCSYCDSHLGWRFTVSSSKKLHPKKFYGISRRSIRQKLEMEDSQQGKPENTDQSEFRPIL